MEALELKSEDNMSSVKCPMCNETIEGDSPEKLSMKLKVHLIHIHEMAVIDEVTRFSSEPSGGSSPESRKKVDAATQWAGESKANKKVDAATQWAGESKANKKVDAATQWAGESKANKNIDAATQWAGESGDSPESMKLIEVVTRLHYVASSTGQRPCIDPKMEGKVMVSCPMCDSIVYGDDEESLSKELKNHIDCVHNL